MKPVLCVLAIALTLGACADRDADDLAPAPTPVDATGVAAAAPQANPSPPPQPSSSAAPASGEAMPAAGAIDFDGFGPAAFGADAEAVRQSWGSELDGLPKQSDACYYLAPPIEPGRGYAIAFMIEGGAFVRLDVAREGIAAPGGGEVGMDAAQIESLYPGLESRQHKYVDNGQYLRVADPDGGNGVLVFEVGADGVVEEWRIGVPPQVDYVEGCS